MAFTGRRRDHSAEAVCAYGLRPKSSDSRSDSAISLLDFESDSGRNHNLSLLASQITSVEVLGSPFDPSSFVTWDTARSHGLFLGRRELTLLPWQPHKNESRELEPIPAQRSMSARVAASFIATATASRSSSKRLARRRVSWLRTCG